MEAAPSARDMRKYFEIFIQKVHKMTFFLFFVEM